MKTQQIEAVRLPGLRFTGQPRNEKVDVIVSHPTGYIDDELAAACVDTLRTLAVAIHAARGQENPGKSRGEAAKIEALLGYSILSYNEGRAFLIVAAAGLSRHARIHFRNLMEYRVRLDCLLSDEKKAQEFWNSLAHEMKAFAEKLGNLDESVVEDSIAEIYGNDIPAESFNERKILFIKGQITETLLSNQTTGRANRAIYDRTGHVAHGSILALREVARDAAGSSSGFLNSAADDGQGNELTFRVVDKLLLLAARLSDVFGMPPSYASDLDNAIMRNSGAALRLKFISAEQYQGMLTGLRKARQTH